MNAGMLLVSALAVPLAMLAACLSRQLRQRMPSLLVLAPLPAFAAACLEAEGSTVVFLPSLLGVTLTLDMPGAMLLGVGALLWMAAGAYASSYLRGNPNSGRFTVWWLMTLTGNIGAFLAADLPGFYLFFTLASLAAYGLIVFDDTPGARRAAAVYVALAVLGEAFLLMAFVLLAAAVPSGSLLIRDAVASLATSPWRDYAMAFLILAFGLKIGLFPFHVWMPLTYSAAPIAAAAVLSGSAVKVGVIGLIRFLPFESAMPAWGELLAIVGLFSAYYGVVVGITQANPKTVLAYSSVSQMGLLAAVFGMGLLAGDESAPLAGAFSATFHVLVKGGLFLALGVAAQTKRSGWLVLVPAAVLALGLGGLPLTGGALAKSVVKPVLGDGIIGTLASFAAIGSTLLMLHFLRRMWSGSHDAEMSGALVPWLATALAAIALPWALYSDVADASLRDTLAVKEIWEAFWPVLLGALMSLALLRWGDLLPRIPAGDLLEADTGILRAARGLGAAMEQIDKFLRQWVVASAMLIGLVIILCVSSLVAR
jgi:formate hydrogenlyase subunit 3/multisubunit Na+/H+ antiporter MnhD subunit